MFSTNRLRKELKDIELRLDDLTPEMQLFIKDIGRIESIIPDFNPRRTALFTSIYPQTRLYFHMIPYYKNKIRNELFWLLDHGYTELIVSYGNAYGMFAMRELIRYRNKGLNFNLFSSKVFGERNHLPYKGKRELELVLACDEWLGLHYINIFIAQIIHKVSIISFEDALAYSHQKVPRSLAEHYRNLSQHG